MKVIIDTNVLISAILRDKSPEKIILWICSQPDWEWVVSPEIMTEYEDVLRRKKFSFPTQIIREWLDVLNENTVLMEIENSLDFPRDQKDAKFLACALECNVDYLVTGDLDFSEARQYLNTTVLSVSMFKKLWCDTD